MDSRVKSYECYDFNDELILIEMLIDDSSVNIDFGEFVVPDRNLPESDWQCAYLEQYLNSEGTEKICDLYDEPKEAVTPCRVAFFIYKFESQERKITTPYGTFSTKSLKPVPKRLLDCIEFDNEDDED